MYGVPDVVEATTPGGSTVYYYKGKLYTSRGQAYSAQSADIAAWEQAEAQRRATYELLKGAQRRSFFRTSSVNTKKMEAQWKTALAQLQSKILDIVSRGQSYSQQIMDRLVTEGLSTVHWQKQKQEELFEKAGEILAEARKPVSESAVRALAEPGTQGILESQRQALARQEAALAAKGLLGSTASEAAYARVASQAGTQIAKLQAAAMQTALQRKHEAQLETIKTMAGIIQGSPIASTLAELAKTGVLASQFAVPNFKF